MQSLLLLLLSEGHYDIVAHGAHTPAILRLRDSLFALLLPPRCLAEAECAREFYNRNKPIAGTTKAVSLNVRGFKV